MSRSTLAITGGTGFVGSTLIRLAVEEGWQVRALARRQQSEMPGVEWIAGGLGDAAALEALVKGSSAIIHVAGVTNAPNRQAFVEGNISGTEAMIAAAQANDVQRFIHVSSLAGRMPGLSNYGWSKAEAENRVIESNLAWTVVRPPAVYGPGDRDHLDMFKAARFHVMPLPPEGRLSTIEVSDLGRSLLACVNAPSSVGHIFEVDDGVEHGWSHAEYGRAIGAAIGKWVLPLPVPAPFVQLGARLDRLFRGSGAKLTPDRASYYCHPDWVIDSRKRPSAALWTPRIETKEGLKATAAAYRQAGWL